MSYENETKQQVKGSQVYCKELYNKLVKFFNICIIMIIVLCFIQIFLSNQLQLSRQKYQSHSVPSHTKEHIDHYFIQTQNQLYFISKTIAKSLDLQYQNYLNTKKIFYEQKDQLTAVQKMLYLNKYNTSGEYHCTGNCTGLQFYLINLWAKRVSFHSIGSIYVKYYDPISNTTNIIYTPKDKNFLQSDQIQALLQISTNQQQQQNYSLTKVRKGLYYKSHFTFNTSFDQNYQLSIAIQLRQSQIQRILKSDVESFSFYHYEIYDSYYWISLSASESLPLFSYIKDQKIYNISYEHPSSNKTLITFYFQMPSIVIYFSFIKFSLLLPILIFVLVFFQVKIILKNASIKFFKNTKTLVSLYEYNIQQIFTGNQPKQTIILTDTTITQFYQQLSQLPTTQYEPILHKKKKKVPPKNFLFVETLKAIVQKYNQYAKNIFKEKNKEIVNNKFFIHTSVNELSEAQSIKIKENFNKARDLGTLRRFFKYSYLSLLLNPIEFDRTIQEDSSPLPEQFIKLTREINRTVSGTDVRRAFKLSPNIMRQTQQELEIRIQINLIQKYFQILNELDIHRFFAKEIGLDRQLQNLNDYVQNLKHLFNKHNKNIRTLGR